MFFKLDLNETKVYLVFLLWRCWHVANSPHHGRRVWPSSLLEPDPLLHFRSSQGLKCSSAQKREKMSFIFNYLKLNHFRRGQQFLMYDIWCFSDVRYHVSITAFQIKTKWTTPSVAATSFLHVFNWNHQKINTRITRLQEPVHLSYDQIKMYYTSFPLLDEGSISGLV